MDWLNKELSRIKDYSPYKRPGSLQDYHKLDSNENTVLEKKFIRGDSIKITF